MASKVKTKANIIKELFVFLWHHRMWWLVPFVVILIIAGLLMIIGESTVLGPFIYTLF